MSKRTLVVMIVVAYLVAGFFLCNPEIISEFSANSISEERIFAEEETFIWNGHYSLVRLEDVNPSSDLVALAECIDLLQGKNIPFSIALIPIYKNPEQNITIHLSERPELVQIIKDSGATIVLHGCTHQYDGETAVDFEFWDEILNQPIPENNTEYAISKIERAIEELNKCNLSTEIWETPHYTTTYEVAKAVSRYFSKTYEGTSDRIVINEFGQIVIPTNLYYVKGEHPETSVFEILENAENISSNNNNDTVASFHYHPFLGPAYLETIIEGLEKQGYEFVSPEKYTWSISIEKNEIAPQYL